jgi:hypothetical protein
LIVSAPLDDSTNADMMSDMKTFTVRDLDRKPGEILKACDSCGVVRVRTRGGKQYLIKPEIEARPRMGRLPDFAMRRSRLFAEPLTKGFARRLDQALAGE